MIRQFLALGLTSAAAMLSACTVGPDYAKPPAAVPARFKEAEAHPPGGWKQAEPHDAADKGSWWSIYNDPVLDGLEKQVAISNQTLKENEAAFRQARAIVEEARSSYYPTLSVGAGATRSGSGAGNSSSRNGVSSSSTSTSISTGTTTTVGSGGTTIVSSGGSVRNDFSLTSSISWDVDLWGRIRRTVESDIASAQASAGDVANARLSAQSELATDYLDLRVADENKRLLDDTVNAYTISLNITQRQYNVGVAARSDVIQAQTQLEGAQAQAVDIGQVRAQYEHAIAVLIGKAPADLTIAPVKTALDVPTIPAAVPSTLLERRPDIAAAERRAASANALIGVAIAAYYPDFTLSASGDFASTMIGTLVHASSFAWSAGGSLSETVFDAGLRSAQIEAARAVYDQNVAAYRQTVLTGFQQVEDELAALRIYAEEARIRQKDVESAQLAAKLLLNQYRAGTVAYTSVVTAQTTALGAEESALTVRQNRLAASVTLVEALGGGWRAADLPDGDNLYASDTGVKAESVKD